MSPTPGQERGCVLTLCEAVHGQVQGHIQRWVLDHTGDGVLLDDFGVSVGEVADDSDGLVSKPDVVFPWFLQQDAGKAPGDFWSWLPCC